MWFLSNLRSPAVKHGQTHLKIQNDVFPSGQAAQNYTLKVTALDSNDEPIDYFQDHGPSLQITAAVEVPA
jgi:hypothetical protein